MTNLFHPKISVVVPVLNNAVGLKRCLNSVCCQPQEVVQLIVIDGGSSDDTLEVISEYKFNIAYWETGKDQGISDAFNRGIDRATGDFIAILNSDDYWLPNCFQDFSEVVSQHPDADIYYGKVLYFDITTGYSYVRSPDLSRINKRMYLFHPSMIVRRDAYERIGGYSLAYQFAMDAEWCHRAISQGLQFQMVDAVLTAMQLGGLSDRNYKMSLDEYRSSLLEHGLSKKGSASFNFWKYYLLKSLLRPYWMRTLKQALLR